MAIHEQFLVDAIPTAGKQLQRPALLRARAGPLKGARTSELLALWPRYLTSPYCFASAAFASASVSAIPWFG
jgi:hypothetical protein